MSITSLLQSLLVVVIVIINETQGFPIYSINHYHHYHYHSYYSNSIKRNNNNHLIQNTHHLSLSTELVSDSNIDEDVMMIRKQSLKSKLFGLCASCDRGFGADPTVRREIMILVEELKKFTVIDSTYGLYPRDNNDNDSTKFFLFGAWKMIYTNALDVLSLAASPITLINGIYQIIERDGTSCNIIDLSPRVQALLPPAFVGEGSLLRLKVITKSFSKSNNRVGLAFKSIQIIPKTLFNQKIKLPFQLGGTLPQSLLFPDKEDSTSSSPGFFDVIYLDEDTLIIRQNNVNGYFISIKEKDSPCIDEY